MKLIDFNNLFLTTLEIVPEKRLRAAVRKLFERYSLRVIRENTEDLAVDLYSRLDVFPKHFISVAFYHDRAYYSRIQANFSGKPHKLFSALHYFLAKTYSHQLFIKLKKLLDDKFERRFENSQSPSWIKENLTILLNRDDGSGTIDIEVYDTEHAFPEDDH